MPFDKIEQLRAKKQKLSTGGGLDKIEKQHAKGKLSARERLLLLFDEQTFVELDAFVKCRCTDFGMDQLALDGESVVTG